MGAPIRVTFVGDDAGLQAAAARSEAALARFAGSVEEAAKVAAKAAADQAKAAGLGADEQETAAARAAAAVVESSERMSAAQRAAGQAAISVAKTQGAAADEQVAAAQRAIAAQKEAELAAKAAADAAAEDAAKVVEASRLQAAAQAEAAAKADLLTAHLGTLGEKATSVAAEITKFGTIGFAASIAGVGDLAAKYQEATQSIAANSDISSKAAAKIGAAFLGTSGTTIYSGKELTEAFAGVAGQLKSTEGQALSTAQAMRVMAVASNLGEATGETLGSATSALAMIMQGYRLSVGQAASAGDLLFNVSRQLDMPMETVAQSMTKLHGRLGDLAPSMGDVGGLMVELGAHGVQGTRGVSVMDTAFQTLIGDSQPVQQMLDTLGVKIFNSQGKFVGLRNVIKQLQPVFAGLTQQSQDLAAKTLFGSSASQVMLSVIQRGPAAFAAYTAAAEKHGTAVKGAADQDKTFAKQFDILKASVDNAATSIGLKLMPELTTMSRDLADGVDWLSKNKGAAEALGIAFGAVLGPAVLVFTGQKLYGLTEGLRGTVSGITNLGAKAMGLGPVFSGSKTETQELTASVNALTTALTTVPADAEAATGPLATLGGAAATAGGSFATMTTDVKAATAQIDGQMSLLSDAVVADDERIVVANEAAGTSWLKLIPIIGGVVVAAEALKGPINSLSKDIYSATGGALGTGATYSGKKGQFTKTQAETDAKKIAAQSGGIASQQEIYQAILQGGGIKGTKQATEKSSGASGKDLEGITETAGGLVKAGSGKAGAVDYKTGNFPTAENTFIQLLSAKLGYNPAVIAGWADAEQPPGQPANSANPDNFLNIGENGSTYRGSPTNIWQNPVTAAEAAAQWVKTGKGVPGWGASGVGSITAAAGGSIQQQIAAIQHSGWVGGGGISYPNLPADVQAVLGKGSGITFNPSSTGNKSLSKSVLNIGSGGTLPAVLQTAVASNQATLLSDQANQAQAVGQAQVTWLQAIDQRLQDVGTAIVQKLSDQEAIRSDGGSVGAMSAITNAILGTSHTSLGRMGTVQTQTVGGISAASSTASLAATQGLISKGNGGAAQVAALKDLQQMIDDRSTELVTALKAQQTVADQHSAILVAKITDATTAINDASAVNVAVTNAAATQVADADNAAATLVTDNAQTNADTISERGLYGLNLVAQQLQVVADNTKTYWDQQIAVAQAQLDYDQGQANIANAKAQQVTDQVTSAQNLLVLQAQQNLNMVTMRQDALEAKAQQHLDAVTAKEGVLEAAAKMKEDTVIVTQDAKANAAQAHLDAVTVSQDNRILKATQHADAVQVNQDLLIGNAQLKVLAAAGGTKAQQTAAQNNLNQVTAQGSEAENAAQAQLAGVTSSANSNIAGAQNSYQSVQNTTNTAIQNATDAYTNAMNTGNTAIQNATDAYNTVQDAANTAIQNATDNYNNVQDTANQTIALATQTAAQTLTSWTQTLAGDQSNLTGVQGKGALAEAQSSGAVTGEQALASTQFAGSGLVVNLYGIDMSDASGIGDAVSWAVRTAATT